MTIGPDPRMRIVSMSSRLGIGRLPVDSIAPPAGSLPLAITRRSGGGADERGTAPGPAHQRGEVTEQVARIVRTWRRLGVVLHAERRHVVADDALVDAVVEVDVRGAHATEAVGLRQ